MDDDDTMPHDPRFDGPTYEALAAENARFLAAWSRLEADHNAACAENGRLRERLDEATTWLRRFPLTTLEAKEMGAFLQRTDAGREEKKK